MAVKNATELSVLENLTDDVIVVIGDQSSGEYLSTTVGALKTYFSTLSGATIEVATTKAAIQPGNSKRLVLVNADETNNGDRTLYIHNGNALILLLIIPA